jgi:HSP20 family molecular chaperone IbpA
MSEFIRKNNSEIDMLRRRVNSPKVDLYENETKVFVIIEIAGAQNAAVNLKDNQILLVSFKKDVDITTAEFTAKYTECKYGHITRRIKLPSLVFYNKNYTLIDGVFKITFDKKRVLPHDTVAQPQAQPQPHAQPQAQPQPHAQPQPQAQPQAWGGTSTLNWADIVE